MRLLTRAFFALMIGIGSSLFGARPMSRQEEEQQLREAMAVSMREQRGAAAQRPAQPAVKRPEQMSFEEQMAYALRQSQEEGAAAQAHKPAKLPAQMSFEEQMAHALEESKARPARPAHRPAARASEDEELKRVIALSLAEAAEQEKKGAEQKIEQGESAAEHARLDRVKEHYLRKVKPPVDCYRPTVLAGGKAGSYSNRMELACLLVGRKTVWSGDDQDIDRISPDLRTVFQRSFHRLDLLKKPILTSLPNQYMTFLYPKGNKLARLYASLLLKNLSDYWALADENWRLRGEAPHSTNSYLNGFLLGYPEEDIIEFYKYNFGGPRLSNEEAAEIFEKNKLAAVAWIRENAPGSEEWVEENELKGTVKVDKW